jgi:hypothetical protein
MGRISSGRSWFWALAATGLASACGSSGPVAFATGGGGHGGDGSASSASAGSTASTGGAGGGETCPNAGDACTTCEATACPQIYCDCYHSPECLLMAACTTKCNPSDVACNQPCWTAHPTAISAGALLVDCAGSMCPAGCPGYQPLTKCQVCLYTRCQSAMNTCIANPDCTKLLICIGACTTPACETSCYQQFPNGAADAGPVANCTQAHCATECTP